MHVYLTLDDVKHMHADQIARYGGSPGIRDEGLILSALLRPQTGYYADLIEEAAALWESLAMNHGFVDGNKRIALAATDVFLNLNGVAITAEPEELITFIYSNLEAGTFRKDVIEAWLHSHTAPLAP